MNSSNESYLQSQSNIVVEEPQNFNQPLFNAQRPESQRVQRVASTSPLVQNQTLQQQYDASPYPVNSSATTNTPSPLNAHNNPGYLSSTSNITVNTPNTFNHFAAPDFQSNHSSLTLKHLTEQ